MHSVPTPVSAMNVLSDDEHTEDVTLDESTNTTNQVAINAP